MADAFLHLPAEDRREALVVAADRSGRPVHLLEKDVWVVWALAALYGSPLGEHLVFKGGTSLSKAYGVIRRFSEDVDLTYDIRTLAPDMVDGARSTGEPASLRDIACDASGLIEGVTFPTARPRVMHAERTFWEKATAIHVFCLQERLRGDRFARHWHDVARLDEAGFATSAFADRDLANAVARHKTMFFAEKALDRSGIDYAAAVNGGLQLVPAGDGVKVLEEDYARMVEDGLLLEDAEPFADLMERCEDIAARANVVAG